MSLVNVMLSERIQSQKDTHWVIPLSQVSRTGKSMEKVDEWLPGAWGQECGGWEVMANGDEVPVGGMKMFQNQLG